MKEIPIKNISLRLPSDTGYTHLVFTDDAGGQRLGRVIPFPVDTSCLETLLRLAETGDGIVVPDGFSPIPDGTFCLSLPLRNSLPATGELSPKDLLEPLRSLQGLGLNHLSMDQCSWVLDAESRPALIYWGDGLFRTSAWAPPEVRAGGFPGLLSDLYMAAEAALCRRWHGGRPEMLKALLHGEYTVRLEAAAQLGFTLPEPPRMPFKGEIPGLSLLTGGDWQTRDALLNRLVADSSAKGWACRVLRRAAGEQGRPLPDVPPGTVTTTPGQLLSNAFHRRPGMEKLLVISDLCPVQHDLAALIEKMGRVIPSGLHIIVSTSEDMTVEGAEVFALEGESSQAVDIPLSGALGNRDFCCAGPSWYGPRCRISTCDLQENDPIELPDKTLFGEGAWLHTVYAAGKQKSPEKAESLLRLGRYAEALETVPVSAPWLRGEILMALGRYGEAVKLLRNGDPLLLSRALKGTGRIREALGVLEGSGEPAHLPELAELYDLSGEPAKALPLLINSLGSTTGTVRTEILCALRNLETRLGMYADALEHAEMAIRMSRDVSSIPLVVESLQSRGRTLIVLGRWADAEEDFNTAVSLHDENALFTKRPPHIDLFDLQLRMGNIARARSTFKKLEKLLAGGGVPGGQMLSMLKAYRGALLGEGEGAISHALKAEELASRHGMELYGGISTLYAGRLYLQAGKRERGLNLLERARARGHVLGDRHLELLAEIELLLSGMVQGPSPVRPGTYSGELTEERLILRIIEDSEADGSFSELLDLPSPLTACRLADICGFPESPVLRKRLLKARELIAEQLSPGERKNYLAAFVSEWAPSGDPVLLSQEGERTLNLISRWMYEYGEGMADLDSLASSLGLESITLHEVKGAVRVPGGWPMYLKGENAPRLAPLLSAASVLTACLPGNKDAARSTAEDETDILGSSEAIRGVRYHIRRFAGERVPVLITGETGTGKELCARAIHRMGPGSRGGFVPVDCGAIPENLLESELFGAAAGAYTGIAYSRNGLLQEADGGTLFLDEIGNLPLHMQVKLLRVLDTGTFRKLGENRERKVNMRVIAATNSVLEERIQNGSFRSDLYYRLAVVRIHIPPLRERIEDIEPLAVHFSGSMLTPGALDILRQHSWPGNVRELQNVIRRAALASSGGMIRSCHITPSEAAGETMKTKTLQRAIADHVQRTVAAAGGNRSLAARILDCDPKTVRKYLREEDS